MNYSLRQALGVAVMTFEFPLNQPFEAEGEWYRPDVPDRKIRGTLSYKDGWSTLRLEDRFEPLPTSGTVVIRISDPRTAYPTIHGVTREGRKLTLIKARQEIKALQDAPAIFNENVMTSLALVDAHVTEQSLYKEMVCRVPGLAIWLGHPIMRPIFHDDEPGPEFMEYVVSRVPQQIIRVSAIHANLGLSVGVASSCVGQFDASFKGVGLIRLAPDQPQRLEWYWEQLGKLVEVLTFLFGAPARPDYLQITPAEEAQPA
jgi:hypothetical protein